MKMPSLSPYLAIVAALGYPVLSSHAAPMPGDADFPTAKPCARHDQKVAAVKSGSYGLVLIGDSITQTIGEIGGEWAPLRAVWEKHYAPRHALNLGYSGYRTENILWNLQNGELDFTESPKVVMLLIGTNNTEDQHYPHLHTAEEAFAGTKAIVDLIRQRHPTTKILVLRIFPCGGPRSQTSFHRSYNRSAKALDAARRAGEMTARLADNEHVFWRDIGYVFLRPDGSINTDLMPDLIHPNAAGAEAWAQAIEPTLAQLMGDTPIVDPQLSSVTPVPRKDGQYDWPARHAAALAAKATDPQIVFIGDSITHFLGGIPTPAGAFASPRGTEFWEEICPPSRPGLNLGFGADWTQHVLWRIDHGELDGISPRHVVLMIGTNNILHSSGHNGEGGAEAVVAGVRACLVRIRSKVPDARIILMGVLPCGNPAASPLRATVAEVNTGLKALALEAKCDFLDIGGEFLDADGNIPPALMGDAIHPTPAGYGLWSSALAPLLNSR